MDKLSPLEFSAQSRTPAANNQLVQPPFPACSHSCHGATTSVSGNHPGNWLSSRLCLATQLIFLGIMLYILAGCQPLQSKPDAASSQADEPVTEAPPTQDFSAEAVLSLLTAELAGHRNQPLLALEHYSLQAQSTQNAQITERAYNIAEFLELSEPALQNALLWARLAPESADAQRAAALQLVRAQRHQQAMVHMQRALELEPEGSSHFDWIALSAAHSSQATRDDLLLHLNSLLQDYPKHPSLLLAKALLLQHSDPQQALHTLKSFTANEETSTPTLLLKAQLLQELDRTDESLQVLDSILQQHPENETIRISYARQLIAAQRFESARAEFLHLLQQAPYNDDYRLALGFLNMDLQAWQEAAVYFKDLIARESHVDTALFNLARCQEELQNPEQALHSYAQIQQGQHFLPAIQRAASLLLQADEQPAFIQLFTQARQSYPEQSAELYLLEAEALNQARHTELAHQQIEHALELHPDNHRLLYTRAILAEQLGNLEQLEQDLRLIIEQNPENSIALNALGYTLSTRTDRYDEAYTLILKAYQIDPEDPATMDSMGWIYFKLGQPELAINYLQQAFAAYPDAEIAAHLGEVLWTQGNKRQARKVWQQGLELDAQHPVLLETLQRLDNRKHR